jgi:hypothetical protein
MTEAQVQTEVIRLLAAAGAFPAPYHTHDSRRSEPGWPDVAAVVGATLWLVECKTDQGILRPEQCQWLNALAPVPGVQPFIATPSTLDQLAALLGVSRPHSAQEEPSREPAKVAPATTADHAGLVRMMVEQGWSEQRARALVASGKVREQ